MLRLAFTSLALALEGKLAFLGHDAVEKVDSLVVLALEEAAEHAQQVALDPGGVELDAVG